MNVVQALVEKSTTPALDVQGLLDTYSKYFPRSWEEKRRLRSRIAAASVPSIDVRDLYAEALAWNQQKRLPEVALAPIKAERVHFNVTETPSFAGIARLSYAPVGVEAPLSLHHSPPLQKDHPDFELSRHYPSIYTRERSAQIGVPLVPRSILPWNPLSRRRCWVLFDTPVWENETTEVKMIDPYLLERVSETKFRVLGHWDLTEKERQLMALINK